jgi:dihydroflavonol-4-reductase
MRVLVTGPNGFIGSVVARKLAEKGHNVRCLMRSTSDASRLNGVPYEKATGDVTQKETVLEAMSGCDAVLHLASLSNWNDIHSPRMRPVVVDGSRNVIEAAMAHGKLPMVYVSSSAAIDGTLEPKVLNESSSCHLESSSFSYPHAKLEVEALCVQAAQEGLPVSIVNPTEVYGPNDTALNTAGNLIDMAKSSPVFVCRGGTSVVHVDDVAEGIIVALSKGKPGSRYILGGDNLEVADLARLSLAILGQNKRIITIPNGLLRTLAKVADTLHLPFPINPKVVPYATRYWFMDNSKAKHELGLSFRGARETLEPTFAWLKSANLIP